MKQYTTLMAFAIIIAFVTSPMSAMAIIGPGPVADADVDDDPIEWTCHYIDEILTWESQCTGHTQDALTGNWTNKTVASQSSSCSHIVSTSRSCNNNPSVSVEIMPSSPNEEDILKCAVTSYNDNDGDALSFTLKWKRGGSNIVPSETLVAPNLNSFLDPNDFSTGDWITCEVTVNDGNSGTDLDSDTVYIKPVINTPPGAPTINFVDGLTQIYDYDSLFVKMSGYPQAVDPTTGVPMTDSQGRPIYVDNIIDNDVVSFIYEWTNTTQIQPGLTGSTIPSLYLDEGDIWSVRVKAYDGTDESSWTGSQSVTILHNYTVITAPGDTALDIGDTYLTDHTRWEDHGYSVTCRWEDVGDITDCCDGSLCSSGTVVSGTKACPCGGTTCGKYGDLIRNSCTGAYDCSNRQGGSYSYWVPVWVLVPYKMCHFISTVNEWTSCSSHMTYAKSVSWSSIEGSSCSHTDTDKECNIPPQQPQISIIPHKVVGADIYYPDTLDDITCKVDGPSSTYLSGLSSNPTWWNQPKIWAASWASSQNSDTLRPGRFPNTWIDPDEPWDIATGQSYDTITYHFNWYKNGAFVKTESVGGVTRPSEAILAKSTISHLYTSVGDIWKCVVIAEDNYDTGLESLPAVYEVEVGPPDLGLCNGIDADGDGCVDEAMYSCIDDSADCKLSGEVGPSYFDVNGKNYCFDCSLINGNIFS